MVAGLLVPTHARSRREYGPLTAFDDKAVMKRPTFDGHDHGHAQLCCRLCLERRTVEVPHSCAKYAHERATPAFVVSGPPAARVKFIGTLGSHP